MLLTPVILSGGSGTRLWPLSRELYPKQLLRLVGGEHTMLQATVMRLQGLGAGAPVIVCNEAHRFLVAEQLRVIGVKPRAILLEPVGRNTAPAIALAALVAPDDLLLVLPADHVIRDVPAFQAAVKSAVIAAERGGLVTFGVVAHSPETGYGYIQRGAADGELFRIRRFVEKPNAERAAEFLASGDYYWNSGMFMFRAQRYLEELRRLAPDIAAAATRSLDTARADLEFLRVDSAEFAACRSESIDYAVMEKTDAAVVVPLDAGWSDVGSWASLHAACEADANGNVTCGDVLIEDSSGNYLYSQSRLVAGRGAHGSRGHRDQGRHTRRAEVARAGREAHRRAPEEGRTRGAFAAS